MGYSYRGFFRYTISSGGGAIGWMYSLRDPAATVRSVDLVNQSHVWYTELILELKSPTLLSDGNRVEGS